MKKVTYPLYHAGEKQSYAAAVVAGDLVFCSGASGVDETGRSRAWAAGVQIYDAMDKVKDILEKAGTSLENIIDFSDFYFAAKIQCMEMWEGPSVFDYCKERIPKLAQEMPACTAVGVQNFYHPEELVQIGIIAAMPGAKTKVYPLSYAGVTKHDYTEKQTFSAANVVGDLVFCSGSSGRLPTTGHVRCGSTSVQVVDALDKVTACLKRVGIAWQNVVRLNYWFVGTVEGETLWEGPIMDYFRKNAPKLAEDMPAVCPGGLVSLAMPDMFVEIEAFAVMPGVKRETHSCYYEGKKQNFAAAVKAGDFVFSSGETGRLPDTGTVRSYSARVQAIDALDKIKASLEKAGTSLENIVRIDYAFVGNVGETLWEGPIMDCFRKNAPKLAEDMPAVTRIGVKNLRYPEELVQLAVIAIMPD